MNDGSVGSGHEVRTSDVLRGYLTAEMMAGRFHGNDERIDVESLALTTQAWLDVCETFLG